MKPLGSAHHSACGADRPVAVAVSNVPVSCLWLGFLLTHIHWFFPVFWGQSPSLPSYAVTHQYPASALPFRVGEVSAALVVCSQEPDMHSIMHASGMAQMEPKMNFCLRLPQLIKKCLLF